MRGVTTCAVLLLGAVSGCAPDAGFDERRIAAHARDTYTWTASSCRSGAFFGSECEDEIVSIESVVVADPGLVTPGEIRGAWVELFTAQPGTTTVDLSGGDRDAMEIDVEVVTPTVRFDLPWAEPSPVVLRGATDRFDYRLVDDLGELLHGIAMVDIESQGLSGVVVEPVVEDNAVLVRVPDKVGAFQLVPMERGLPFRVEVMDAGDVDGVEVFAYDVYSDTREIVPTIDGVPVRAGAMPYVIEPVDENATCVIDASGWGELPADDGAPDATWGVRLSGDPCELRVTLPAANRGAGLVETLAWPT